MVSPIDNEPDLVDQVNLGVLWQSSDSVKRQTRARGRAAVDDTHSGRCDVGPTSPAAGVSRPDQPGFNLADLPTAARYGRFRER